MNGCFDVFLSGFRPHHSTETALFKVLNDIHSNTDSGKMSVVVLLDLSAAFDTVDHNILLDQLENWVGLSGTTLKWFKSYLNERDYMVWYGIIADYNTIHTLSRCIEQIIDWMCQSFLQLNKDKSEIFFFVSKEERLKGFGETCSRIYLQQTRLL